MKILLLSLHLPVIHIEALSHSSSNITPEYIAARLPVLDSVSKRGFGLGWRHLFAAKKGMMGERTWINNEPQQTFASTQTVSVTRKMWFAQRPSVYVITLACNSSCDKCLFIAWGQVMKETSWEKKKVKSKRFK